MKNDLFASQFQKMRREALLSVTQKEMMKITGWTLQQIKNIEQGRKMFYAKHLEVLADGLLAKKNLILDKEAFIAGGDNLLSSARFNIHNQAIVSPMDRRASAICGKCNFGFYLDDTKDTKDKFCYECGSDLVYKCPDCGSDVSHPAQNFCGQCGHVLRKRAR